ncbi:PAS domain S-box-containing protein [Halorientalis persicus]|uniref:histidine kinase n=1 Tax=Halorientalis persicus TaxID=1367881 RepID=A0A1H8LX47_9EURY|nr:PAS domain S-box protein [Halorientalis persicus]SEO09661.1 PAS domain S-box-containing protein [Halorientalis persicus]
MPGASSFSVLYVGSDERLVPELVGHLSSEALDIAGERTREDALDRLSAEPFDCVVCDAELPDGDARSLRDATRERAPTLPFVALVSDDETAVMAELRDDSATEYVLVDADPEPYATAAKRVRESITRNGERAAAERDELAAALLSETTDAIWVVGESRTITYANESTRRVFGCEPSDVVGDDALRAVAPADTDPVRDLFEAALANPDRTVTGEFRVRPDDSDQRWVECRCRNRVADSVIQGLVVTLTDVTERKRKERQLRRFRQAVEQAGHSIYITDTDGAIEYVNPAFEESTGYDRADAVGQNPNILSSGEHRPEFYAGLWNTILSGNVWKGEVINERRDGERYVVEQTVAPVEDETGTIDRFVAINTDVTQRKAYERRLQRYENIIENLPVGVYRTTADSGGEFVEVNSTLVSLYDAYSKSELLEKSVASFYADTDDRVEFRERLQEERRVTGFEVEQRTLSGERIDVTLTAILTEEDDDVYIDGILQDVTDRRQRERELERKNEQLEQFASIVTHDLRNPLNAAQSRLELARQADDCDHLAVIDEQLVRMEELIEDVLAIARHGKQVEDREPVDLAPLAESCWGSVETGNAELIVDTDRTISVDTSRIQQLFENLFRNAVEHGSTSNRTSSDDAIEHGGRDVTVRVGTLSDGFYVEDDGPGIPAEEREDVFEHGYTTDDQGTGFGLNIVQEIVNAHGWEIRATAGTEGGARFEITDVERWEQD